MSGSDQTIGGMEVGMTADTPFSTRYTPEQFAEYFDLILADAELDEYFHSHPLEIYFHTCNSAYIDDTFADETTAKQKMLDESVIGKFLKAMNEKGYTDIKVVGFRGFYSTMDSGAGARVSPTVDDTGQQTFDAQKAQVTIVKKPNQNPVVTLPTGKALSFAVEMPTIQHAPKPPKL